MEGYRTPPPAYTLPSDTTYTPPAHDTVTTNSLIHRFLTSPSPSPPPEPDIIQTSALPVEPAELPIVPRKRPGRPKADPQTSVHTIFELLVHVIMPEKRVRQRGGKTKNEKQEPIKKGPIEVSIEIGWDSFLDEVADLVQTTTANLIVDGFEWCWLKPANGSWLPLTNERGLNSMVKQVSITTKSDPYIILRMQPPRSDNVQVLVRQSHFCHACI